MIAVRRNAANLDGQSEQYHRAGIERKHCLSPDWRPGGAIWAPGKRLAERQRVNRAITRTSIGFHQARIFLPFETKNADPAVTSNLRMGRRGPAALQIGVRAS